MLRVMELEAAPRASALSSATPDIGLGSVWPTAVLAGASLAGVAAAGAWFGGAVTGAEVRWNLAVWTAEHALWGTAAGAVVALVLRLVQRALPAIADPTRRRILGRRWTVRLVSAGLLAVVVWQASGAGLQSLPSPVFGPLFGLLAGIGLWIALARRVGGLVRLDPARVAALVALVTLPLANGLDPGAGTAWSLLGAWRALLAG